MEPGKVEDDLQRVTNTGRHLAAEPARIERLDCIRNRQRGLAVCRAQPEAPATTSSEYQNDTPNEA